MWKKCRITAFAENGISGFDGAVRKSIGNALHSFNWADLGTNGWEKPADFCESAWNTLSPFVMALAHGGENFYDGWMKNPKSVLLSCNDGFRPVSFLVEALEEDGSEV